MNLLALVDFTLVAAHGGFGRASRATGRPKATLSRRVAELEAAMGVPLIDRGTRSLRLTEAGTNLSTHAGRLLAQINALVATISECSDKPRGHLRISAPVVFASLALSGIATRYVQDYPEVEIEIVADERYVVPVEEGFDIVVRANPAPDEQMVGRLVLRDERLVIAPPSLPKPAAGAGHLDPAYVDAVLLTTASYNDVWRFGGDPGGEVRPKSVLRLSSLSMVHEAILAGAGVGVLPRMLVSRDLASGRLVSWGVLKGGSLELWALHAAGRTASAKIRLFLDCLASRFPNQVFVPES